MPDTDRIRRYMERSIKAISLRPAVGLHTAVSKTRITEGLTCEIEEGSWKLTADLSSMSAGESNGPDPGVLGRGALGSCLAMSYVMWASYRDLPVSSVEVEVQADFDAAAQFGLGDSEPGYTEIRYTVAIESTAPDEDVMRVIDEAESNSPYLDVFARGQKMIRNVVLNSQPKG
jgi:uncharacterized OsmC-like protein